jgi:hypothetical protein
MRTRRILVALAIVAIALAALGSALLPSAAAPPSSCIGGALVILNGQERCVDLPSGR